MPTPENRSNNPDVSAYIASPFDMAAQQREIEIRNASPTLVWDRLQGLHDPVANRDYTPGEEGKVRTKLIQQIEAGQVDEIVVVGPAGAGKSTIIGALAARLNALSIALDIREFDYTMEFKTKMRPGFPKRLTKWQPYHWAYFNQDFIEDIEAEPQEPIVLPNGTAPKRVIKAIEMSMGVKEGEDKARTALEWEVAQKGTSTKFLFVALDAVNAKKAQLVRATTSELAKAGLYQFIEPMLHTQYIRVDNLDSYIRRKRHDLELVITPKLRGEELALKFSGMGPADRVEEGANLFLSRSLEYYKAHASEIDTVVPASLLSKAGSLNLIEAASAPIIFMDEYRKQLQLNLGRAQVVINKPIEDTPITYNANAWEIVP